MCHGAFTDVQGDGSLDLGLVSSLKDYIFSVITHQDLLFWRKVLFMYNYSFQTFSQSIFLTVTVLYST